MFTGFHTETEYSVFGRKCLIKIFVFFWLYLGFGRNYKSCFGRTLTKMSVVRHVSWGRWPSCRRRFRSAPRSRSPRASPKLRGPCNEEFRKILMLCWSNKSSKWSKFWGNLRPSFGSLIEVSLLFHSSMRCEHKAENKCFHTAILSPPLETRMDYCNEEHVLYLYVWMKACIWPHFRRNTSHVNYVKLTNDHMYP